MTPRGSAARSTGVAGRDRRTYPVAASAQFTPDLVPSGDVTGEV
jgi:hypothetical protein